LSPELENFTNLLAKKSLNYYDFIQISSQIPEITELFNPKDFAFWRTLGLDIMKLDNGKITLRTREIDISEQIFCITDIETTGSVNSGQIIEIGALKVQNGEIIDKFESFCKAEEIPEQITELTGITLADVENAPSVASVMEKFRLFLGKSVFVAHNVKFDYNFISQTLQNLGYGPLLNRRICTIELARRTIPAEKYGLDTLKEMFGIENAHHRALNDAISANEIFKISLSRLPWHVQTTEDLITFSKTAPNLKLKPQEN